MMDVNIDYVMCVGVWLDFFELFFLAGGLRVFMVWLILLVFILMELYVMIVLSHAHLYLSLSLSL